MLNFEWDEPKRLSNIQQHSLDFLDVDVVFENTHIVSEACPDPRTGEPRFIASGYLEGLPVEVVFCLRGEIIRVISFHPVKRKKRKNLDAALQQRRNEGDATPRQIADRPRAGESDDG